VLVAVAGFGAKDRLDEAADARLAESYIQVAMASSRAMSALQTERALSVHAALTDGEVELLDETRAATDQAVLEVNAARGDVDATSPVGAAAATFADRVD